MFIRNYVCNVVVFDKCAYYLITYNACKLVVVLSALRLILNMSSDVSRFDGSCKMDVNSKTQYTYICQRSLNKIVMCKFKLDSALIKLKYETRQF